MEDSSKAVRRLSRRSSFVLFVLLAAALALVVSACGGGGDSTGSSSSESTSGSGQSTEASASGPSCGAETHEAATGKPIVLGAIVTKQPGVDFSQAPNGIEAYFDCMNENGGVDGRPLELDVVYEQSNPQEVAAAATKLLNNNQVLGMVGNQSLSDCAVNNATYEKEGIYVIGPGVSQACFESPNYASTIGGPTVDVATTTSYLFEQFGAEGGYVAAQTQCPGCGAFNVGGVHIAEAEGVSDPKSILVPVPVSNPSALTLQLANEAGDGGALVLAFTGPELTKILNAASQQGLQERVHWGCVSLCSTPETAQALDSAWEENLAGTYPYTLPSAGDPETGRLEEVIEQYGDEEIGAFNEFGMVTAMIAGDALLNLKSSELTREGVNNAFKNIKDYESSLLCEPWTYSEDAVTAQHPFVFKDGEMTETEGGCAGSGK